MPFTTVGQLRHAQHRSLPEIHAELARHGVPICLRSVGNLLDRYDELLTLSTSEAACLRRLTAATGKVLLAINGLQPDVGHEVFGSCAIASAAKAKSGSHYSRSHSLQFMSRPARDSGSARPRLGRYPARITGSVLGPIPENRGAGRSLRDASG